MRRHLLCKAQLQDAMQFLKRWSTNSTSAFCINVHSSARSQYSAPGPCMLSRSSFQRVLATTSLASQDSTIDELHVTSSTTNTSNSMDFPGGRVPFTDRLDFEGGPFTQRPPLSCYRTLDSKGMPFIIRETLELLIITLEDPAKGSCICTPSAVQRQLYLTVLTPQKAGRRPRVSKQQRLCRSQHTECPDSASPQSGPGAENVHQHGEAADRGCHLL